MILLRLLAKPAKQIFLFFSRLFILLDYVVALLVCISTARPAEMAFCRLIEVTRKQVEFQSKEFPQQSLHLSIPVYLRRKKTLILLSVLPSRPASHESAFSARAVFTSVYPPHVQGEGKHEIASSLSSPISNIPRRTTSLEPSAMLFDAVGRKNEESVAKEGKDTSYLGDPRTSF